MPAYFNDAQRQATKDAGRIAGLQVERLVNEPTAAALAYGLDKKKDETIAVYDFGGGTFDISILEVGEGVVEVKATNGDTHLGGDNLDQRIIDWLLAEFKKDQGIDLGKRPDGDAAPQGGGGEGEDRALDRAGDRDQPAVHHRRRVGSQAPEPQARRARSSSSWSRTWSSARSVPAARRSRTPASRPRTSTRWCWSAARPACPTIQKLVKDFFGKEPHKGVNPDEVVAIGAAIQGGVLTGDVKDMLLLDVTPLSLGIETLGGVFTKLIDRNTTIPTRKSEIFSTAADNQTSVEVHVLQGEREMAQDNRTLGRFHLVGIPPAPRGMPQIEVTFDIDANGIVNVSAKDLGTGKEQKITISGSSGLDESDIKRMVKDAEAHGTEDKERRAKAEARNRLDSLVYSTEKTLGEHKDKLSARTIAASSRTRWRTPRRRSRAATPRRMEAAAKTLTEASHKLAEADVLAAGAGAGAGCARCGRRRAGRSAGRRSG